jgi:hypothetical protein
VPPKSPLRAASSASARVVQDRSIVVGDATVQLTVEDLGGRRRRISGGVDVEAPLARVWHVLTQYALMDRYMPNITRSKLCAGSDGALLLDQVGVISRKLGLKSRMLMRVAEDLDADVPSITFSRVEGRDFSEFEGRYLFRRLDGGTRTRLDYELYAVPMPLFPVALVERKIVKEVPAMLASVRDQALFGGVVAL